MKRMINTFCKPISLGDTRDLPTETWLEWRRHGPGYRDKKNSDYLDVVIGGSDISAIFGVNPFKTIDDLYDDKCGIPHRITSTSAELKDSQDSGHLFENLVAIQFKRKMENEGYVVSVMDDTNFYQCGTTCCNEDGVVLCDENGDSILKYPFACANLDRMVTVNGKTAILECKTISAANFSMISNWKNGIVPFAYELQCRYYMAITNIDVCYICCCWGFRLTDMAIIKLVRNYEEEEYIMEAVKDFADCVRNRNRPTGIQQSAEQVLDYLKRRYGIPEADKPIITLEKDTLPVLFDAMEIEDQISHLNNRIEILTEQKNSILANLAEKIITEGSLKAKLDTGGFGSFTLTVKPSRKNSKLDKEKLMSEEKELYDRYCTAFDEKAFKSDDSNREILTKYTIPTSIDPEGPLTVSLQFKDTKERKKKK